VRPEEKTDAEIQRRIAAALEDWRTDMRRAIRGEIPIDPVHCEVQVIRIGALFLVGVAGEPFFEIGEAIRAETRFLEETGFLWPLGYTNAFCGYIPTRAEYPRGGYEVNDSWKYLGLWKIDDTCEERVIQAATALLHYIRE
jgi:hypothetical protein